MLHTWNYIVCNSFEIMHLRPSQLVRCIKFVFFYWRVVFHSSDISLPTRTFLFLVSKDTRLPLTEDSVANSSEVVPCLTWEKLDYALAPHPLQSQDMANLYCQRPKNMCRNGFYKCQKNPKSTELNIGLDWTYQHGSTYQSFLDIVLSSGSVGNHPAWFQKLKPRQQVKRPHC